MPTDNPKISAYVPQVVYDKFKEFEKSSGLSMSQSATVIFAKHFGIEDVIREITEETTYDDSALDRIEKIESQISDILNRLGKLESEPNSKLLDKIKEVAIKEKDKNKTPQLNLLGEPESKPITLSGRQLSVLRFGLSKDTVSGRKRKDSTEKFIEWTKERDPDNIPWKFNGANYEPACKLLDELRSKLLKWIEENIS